MGSADGSAGDADYGAIGGSYSHYRRPDPRIATQILEALGAARTVVNVGAGSGSYEPTDREVIPIEPSSAMRAQRPAHLGAAMAATAEQLPFPDRHFDAAMATFSVHQWRDLEAGLGEMRRVSRGLVVILTCDPSRLRDFWLNEYAPEVIDTEVRRYPTVDELARTLAGRTRYATVAVPLDCADGFNEAYYGRPERLLDPEARMACSAWSFVAETVQNRFAHHLGRDPDRGSWDERFGHLRSQSTFKGALTLVVSEAVAPRGPRKRPPFPGAFDLAAQPVGAMVKFVPLVMGPGA